MRANPLIVTFASVGYWPLAVNFLAALARVDRTLPSLLGIVCLDAKIASSLHDIGAPCLTREHLRINSSGATDVGRLWQRRLQLALTLTSNGIGVIFSDLDAIWQGDATKFYHKHHASVIASRGSFPASAVTAWGASLCMGFITFKPTAGGVALLSELVDACGITCNDQITINEILLTRARLRWSSDRWPSVPGLAHQPALVRHGQGVLRGTEVSITLLPDRLVDRKCIGDQETNSSSKLTPVRHCYGYALPGKSDHHEGILNNLTLWFLRDGWEAAAKSPPLQRYLQNVSTP